MNLLFNKKTSSLPDYFSPEETKKLILELIMEDISELTQQEIDFLNSCEWPDFIKDRNGGVSPFLYSRIMCLQKFVSLLLKNNYYQKPKDIKIKLKIFVDPDEYKKYLFITALSQDGQPIIEDYNPIKLEIAVKDGKITYRTPSNYFYNLKEKADYLIIKPLKTLTKEEVAFMNNYSWTYLLQNELGRFSPVYGFPIQCLQEYFSRLKQAKVLVQVVNTKLKISYQFDQKKYLIISVLNQQAEIIDHELGSIKILLDEKKGQIKYKVAADFYYDEKAKKDKLFLKEKLSKAEADFINNYYWQDIFVSSRGDFFPVRGSKISCLEKAAKQIQGNLENIKGTKVNINCFYDLKHNQKKLYLTLLNKQDQPIKHNLNPIKVAVSLDRGKIIYSIAEDYYFNVRNRLYKIAQKPFNKLSGEDLQFINEYQGEDYYRSRNGGFFPLPGSRINCLQTIAALFLKKGYFKQIVGTKVTYKLDFDFNKKKKHLLISLYDQQDNIIVDRANPVKIEYEYVNNQFIYNLASDYYYDDWDKLNKLIRKNIDQYTDAEVRWLNSYSWSAKVNDEEGRFRLFKGVVCKGLRSYLNYLFNNELITMVKGTLVSMDLEINKKSKTKKVYLTVLDTEENIIKQRNNNFIYKVINSNGELKIFNDELADDIVYEEEKFEENLTSEPEIFKVGEKIYYLSPAFLASFNMAKTNNYKYIKEGKLVNFDGNFAVIEGEPEAIAIGFLGNSDQEIIESMEQLEEYRLFYQAKMISRYQKRQ